MVAEFYGWEEEKNGGKTMKKTNIYDDLRNEYKNNLKKVKDNYPVCFHPAHHPPMHIVLEPGEYEYTCPGCGHVTIFNVPGSTC